MAAIKSETVEIDGIRTHYLEGGQGPTIVFLHSGEFGGAAEISWEFNLEAISDHYRVIAPDWLGFGRTDKIYDFTAQRPRMFRHMSRFLEVMGIEEATFLGNSMGGSNLARIAAARPVLFPIRTLILASGGGAAPDNEARRALLAYDTTPEAMTRLLHAMLHDPIWGNDAKYVAKRQELALMPGAWEATAASRFKSPATPPRAEFGQPDTTEYEDIAVPTLIIAGANDPLRNPGYADELAERIPDCELIVFENCGHCPNIEMAEPFNRAVIDFLDRVHARNA